MLASRSGGHGAHRDVFRSKYLNVLDFVFGNSGENRHLQLCAASAVRMRD
jgi:hypothetical protein